MDQSSEADALITCLLRSPALRIRAMAAAGKLALFDPVLLPAHAMVWDAVCKLHPLLGEEEQVSLFHLRTELKDRNNSPDKAEGLQEALILIDLSEEIDQEDVSVEVGLRYFDTFYVGATKRDMLEKLSRAYNRDDLSKMINGAAESLDHVGISEETVIERPLLDPVRFMPTSVRIPTGIRWIDQLSFGGHCAHETVGILGPTGGGKTLTATQFQIAQAWRKNNTLLVLYEQPAEGDVSERLFCQIFNDRDIDFFRNTPPKMWPLKDKQRYRELREQFGQYVHVLDFSKGRQGLNGVTDIADAVHAMEDAGQPPKFLIIDWLWPAVRRYCIAHNIPLDRMRAHAGQFIDALKCLTTTSGDMISFLFHQLNTDTARASPARVPAVTDAYELRDFSFMLDTCYVIGNRDKEKNIMWLATDKNRRGAPSAILGKMDGARGRIEPALGMVFDPRGGFISAEEAATQNAPDDNLIAPDDYA